MIIAASFWRAINSEKIDWKRFKRYENRIGVPETWVRAAEKLFYVGFHYLVWDGELWGHEPIGSGTRQGDPCSPIIFVLCTDIIGTKIDEIVANGLDWRAYADDIVISVENPSRRVIRALSAIFVEMEAISGLNLNINKCKVVPTKLWENDEANIFKHTPWEALRGNISYKEVYLCMMFGAKVGGNNDPWRNALSKLEREASIWSRLPAILHTKILISNIFLTPIMMYIGQFYIMPPEILSRVRRCLLRFLTPMFYVPFWFLVHMDLLLEFDF